MNVLLNTRYLYHLCERHTVGWICKVTVNTSNQPLVAAINQLNNKNDQKGNTYSFESRAGGQTIVYPLVLDLTIQTLPAGVL